jgi:hypothetical protein
LIMIRYLIFDIFKNFIGVSIQYEKFIRESI